MSKLDFFFSLDRCRKDFLLYSFGCLFILVKDKGAWVVESQGSIVYFSIQLPPHLKMSITQEFPTRARGQEVASVHQMALCDLRVRSVMKTSSKPQNQGWPQGFLSC